MLAKAILLVGLLLAAIALASALVTGQTYWRTGRTGVRVERLKEPTAFWTIVAIYTGCEVFLLWLMFGI